MHQILSIVILLALVTGACCSAIVRNHRQTEDEDFDFPDISESDCDSSDDDTEVDYDEMLDSRAARAANVFPTEISRDMARSILARSLELLDGSRQSKRICRAQNVETGAANLIKFLVGDVNNAGSQASGSTSGSNSQNSDFCPNEEFVSTTNRRVSFETMRKIVGLHREGRTERGIRGKYPWYRRQDLQRFIDQTEGNTISQASLKRVDEFVSLQVDNAIRDNLPLHDYMLRQWARRHAQELGLLAFRASDHWIDNFKKRHNLVSRKITIVGSRAQEAQRESIEASIITFRENYSAIRGLLPPSLIFNVDQTNFNYEMSNLRVLRRRGTRDVVVNVDSLNKMTHSYTVQVMVARDGTIAGKLLICFQEKDGVFGPRVEQGVRRLEREYGNIVVVSSQSGKMTSRLFQGWIHTVLIPEVESRQVILENYDELFRASPTASRFNHSSGNSAGSSSGTEILDFSRSEPRHGNSSSSSRTEIVGPIDSYSTNSQAIQAGSSSSMTELEPIAGPSWELDPELTDEQRSILNLHRIARRPRAILLADSWGGHSNDQIARELTQNDMARLTIPKHTTKKLQPLDVSLFRQYKKFVKRTTEAALFAGLIGNITSREGLINLHSLIWDQFRATIYHDLIAYGWHNTDPQYDSDELDNDELSKVQQVQFDDVVGHRCEVHGCNSSAFVKCSHCGKRLCIKHFLERVCYHKDDNTTHDTTPDRHRHGHDDDDEGPSSQGSAGQTGSTGRPRASAIIGTGLALGVGGGVIAGASSASAAGAVEIAEASGLADSAEGFLHSQSGEVDRTGAGAGAAAVAGASLASEEVPIFDMRTFKSYYDALKAENNIRMQVAMRRSTPDKVLFRRYDHLAEERLKSNEVVL